MRIRRGNRAGEGIFASVLRGIGFCTLAVALSGAQVIAATFGYGANFIDGTVSVIDTATNTSVATIPVGNGPSAMAVTPDGSHVYVVNVFDSTVSVIATATNSVVGSPIPVGPSIGPSSNLGVLLSGGIVITPSGNSVYVANSGANTVSVIDTASNTVVDTIPVRSQPIGIAITPDGAHVYVANFGDGTMGNSTVSVIDTATNTVVGSPIPVGNFPFAVAITPDGTHAYIADIENGVDVIETATNTVVKTIYVDVPEAIAITPDGTHAYTLSTNPPLDNHVDETVSVIDTATNMVVSSLIIGPSVPIAAYMMAFTPDGAGLYVPNATANSVSVISTASNTVTGSVAVGKGPLGVAFLPHASVPSSGQVCNGLYNGTFNGNITVSAGQNCRFVAGGISGNVVVSGGNFAITSGTVTGNVQIEGAAAFSLGPGATLDANLAIQNVASGSAGNQICGANILGNVAVSGNASPLQFGSASPGSCPGSSIGGNVSIDANAATIAVYGNSVTGSLSCLANQSITGGGNAAKKKLGQCAAF